jgi:hypothetical protein
MPSGGGSVTNDWLIEAVGGSSNRLPGHTYIGVHIDGSPGTVTNSGDILAYGTKSIGVYLNAGGSVTNKAGAEIVGVALAISGTFIGVDIKGAAGTVTNYGDIGLFASGTVHSFTGVYLGAGGSVTNNTGGTIAGEIVGVKISNASGTVLNHGIMGGRDLQIEWDDRLARAGQFRGRPGERRQCRQLRDGCG